MIGAKAIKYFCFGPEYEFPVRAQKPPVVCVCVFKLQQRWLRLCGRECVLTHRAFSHQGNCYSEREYLPDIFAGMQKAHGLIAKADDLLWTGERAPAAVAMLSPRSAYVWDTAAVKQDGQIQIWENMTQFKADYEAELWGIYTALATHSAVSIDFVDEDGLTEEGLKQYKLLLVTAPNVPSENLHAVTRWMQVRLCDCLCARARACLCVSLYYIGYECIGCRPEALFSRPLAPRGSTATIRLTALCKTRLEWRSARTNGRF